MDEQNGRDQKREARQRSSMCTCVTDPFSGLPSELRPRPRNSMGSLRKATCPGCGLVFWTNRSTDLCIDCEKKGVRQPESGADTGG